MTIEVTLGDEDLYLAATNEVEGRSKNAALWAKSMALANGDEAKAKYLYIKLWVLIRKRESESLESNAIGSKDSTPPTALTNERASDPSADDLIPVTIYAGEAKKYIVDIIEEIKRGAIRGQCIDERWYVSASELESVRKVRSSRVAPPLLTTMPKRSLSSALPSDTAKMAAVPAQNAKPVTSTSTGFGSIKKKTSSATNLKAIATQPDVREPLENLGKPASPGRQKNPLEHMFQGDAGLGATYWLWFVVGGFLLSLAMQATASSPLFFAAAMFTMAYQAVVLVGLYRAACKYAGPVIWSLLAKLVVVLGWLFEVALLSMLTTMSNNALLG